MNSVIELLPFHSPLASCGHHQGEIEMKPSFFGSALQGARVSLLCGLQLPGGESLTGLLVEVICF
jgi:hypothetical protein